jgi:hypothetical protein
MTKPNRPVRLSESDRFLLETLGKFCVRARHSSWENVTHSNDIEAISLLREISPLLTPTEHLSLMEGWGVIRLMNDDNPMNYAVEAITQRLQERVESF